MMDASRTMQQPLLRKTLWKEATQNWYIGPATSAISSMGPIFTSVCPYLIPLGAQNSDEERYICSLRDKATDSSSCTIFSIGSNNQYEFEQAVHQTFPSTCKIHTFDCTVARPTPPPFVQYHSICLGSTPERIQGREFTSFSDLVERTGGIQPSLVKMDIEGWEWVALVQLMESAETLWNEQRVNIYPDQLALEIHTNMAPWSLGHMYEEETLAYFNYLYYRHGYVLVYERPNVLCSTCWEVLLVKITCRV